MNLTEDKKDRFTILVYRLSDFTNNLLDLVTMAIPTAVAIFNSENVSGEVLFQERVRRAFLESECAKGGHLMGDLKFSVMLCPRDARRRDLDNYAFKIPQDALVAAGVIKDGKQIVHLEAEMCRCKTCFYPFLMRVKQC